MSVFRIVGPKCALAASHAAPWWVTVSIPTGQTNRYITLSATDAASIIQKPEKNCNYTQRPQH